MVKRDESKIDREILKDMFQTENEEELDEKLANKIMYIMDHEDE